MDPNKHLCLRCTFQSPNDQPPCVVKAPAADKALRGETVTSCSMFAEVGTGRRNLQESKWPK